MCQCVILDPDHLRFLVDSGTLQNREYKFFHTSPHPDHIPKLVCKLPFPDVLFQPSAQLLVHNRIIDQVEIIAEIIAQLFHCKYLTVDPRNFIRMGRMLIMT